MSARNNPFEELERFFQRMSRQFDDASDTWGSEGAFGRTAAGPESAAIDLVEHGDEFVATVDLPGFERDEIDVLVADQTLRIEAEHEDAAEETEERYLRRERRHRSVRRSLRLPDEVDAEGVNAELNNGVLTVRLPKHEAKEPHEIDIE